MKRLERAIAPASLQQNFTIRTHGNLTGGFTGEQSPAVPEPTSLLLLGSGITGIAAKLRRRKENQTGFVS